MRVFGSVARGDAGQTSDVDLLVEALPGTSLFAIVGFRNDLQRLLKCRVDVGLAKWLYPEIKEDVLAEAVTLAGLRHTVGSRKRK